MLASGNASAGAGAGAGAGVDGLAPWGGGAPAAAILASRSARVPLPNAGDATTACSFARLDGGSAALRVGELSLPDVDMVCVDASALAAVPDNGGRDRVWAAPAGQLNSKYARAYSGFRELQGALAAQRAVGALNLADQAWVGLRAPVHLEAGRCVRCARASGRASERAHPPRSRVLSLTRRVSLAALHTHRSRA